MVKKDRKKLKHPELQSCPILGPAMSMVRTNWVESDCDQIAGHPLNVLSGVDAFEADFAMAQVIEQTRHSSFDLHPAVQKLHAWSEGLNQFFQNPAMLLTANRKPSVARSRFPSGRQMLTFPQPSHSVPLVVTRTSESYRFHY